MCKYTIIYFSVLLLINFLSSYQCGAIINSVARNIPTHVLLYYIQTYVGDIVSWVPGDHNKMNIRVK